MHSGEPVCQVPHRAVGQKHSAVRAWLTFIPGAIFFCLVALAGPAPAGQQAQEATAPGFAGSDSCTTCHQEVAKGFASNPHGKFAQIHGKNGVSCESCHGPGKAHVDAGGDAAKIFNPAKGSVKEADAQCLSCHQGQHASFERSGHREANVSCLGCHRVHVAQTSEHLLKAAQPVLCFQCHADIKPQFSMPFHHRVEEGRLNCSDCHDPHEVLGRKGLKSVAEQDAVCTKCHKELAGPFTYEHGAVKTEGCTACHLPHGGPNQRLLTRASVTTICLLCHAPSALAGVHGGAMRDQPAQNQTCTVCHSDVHGSNSDRHFFKPGL